MRIAIVGCGYVADDYLATLMEHPELELAGLADRDPARSARLAARYRTRDYGDLEKVLDDPTVGIVLNLTNPRDHYRVSLACLEAGKHVYTEKPMATDWASVVELVEVAERNGLQICSGPCTLLGEAAQTAWRAIREGAIGRPRLVYAQLDDGMLFRENFRSWISKSGNPWPFKDEFEVGCTLEHAAYYVSWLVAMFGPAESVTSFAACLAPEKGGIPLDPPDTPDFSSGCIQFASGLAARITCSIVGSRDRSFRIFGDGGTLEVVEALNFDSPVLLDRWNPWSFRMGRRPLLAKLLGFGPRKVRPARRPRVKHRAPGSKTMDFSLGLAEMAEAIQDGRPSRLSTRFSMHVAEIILTLQDPAGMAARGG